jgi:hypothetical protein
MCVCAVFILQRGQEGRVAARMRYRVTEAQIRVVTEVPRLVYGRVAPYGRHTRVLWCERSSSLPWHLGCLRSFRTFITAS